MGERLLPGAPTGDDSVETTADSIVDGEVVDAEVVDESPRHELTAIPAPLANRVADLLSGGQPAGARSKRAAEPARSDFLSWRSAVTGGSAAGTDRRLTWPRLLGMVAKALLFVALVSLIVLVAL